MSEQPTEVIPTAGNPTQVPPTGWTPSIVPGMSAPADDPDPTSALVGPAAFDVVLRGYERQQVDRHVAGLAQRVELLGADLEASHARELAALQDASHARADLERGRPSFDALGERVAQLLGLAEAEAAAMRESAERAAAAEREQASQAAATMRSDAQRDAERTVAAARVELSVLQRRRTELLTQVEGIRDALDHVLTSRETGERTIDVRTPEPALEQDETAGF